MYGGPADIDLKPPFALLGPLIETRQYIAGDSAGQVFVVDAQTVGWLRDSWTGTHIAITPGRTSVRIPVLLPMPLEPVFDLSRPMFEYEDIAPVLVILDDTWALRCAYGPRSRVWVTDGEPYRVPAPEAKQGEP